MSTALFVMMPTDYLEMEKCYVEKYILKIHPKGMAKIKKSTHIKAFGGGGLGGRLSVKTNRIS